MFKELPILECEDNYAKAMNYLILALTAYQTTAEVIFWQICKCCTGMPSFQTYAQIQKIQKLQMESSSNIQLA